MDILDITFITKLKIIITMVSNKSEAVLTHQMATAVMIAPTPTPKEESVITGTTSFTTKTVTKNLHEQQIMIE